MDRFLSSYGYAEYSVALSLSLSLSLSLPLLPFSSHKETLITTTLCEVAHYPFRRTTAAACMASSNLQDDRGTEANVNKENNSLPLVRMR